MSTLGVDTHLKEGLGWEPVTSRGKKGKRRDKLIDAFSDEGSNNSLTERQIPIVQRAHQTGDDWRSRFERTGVDSDTDSEVSALLMGDD